MTGKDLISSALRLIQVLATGETPEDADVQDAAGILNGMLDSWAIERLLVFSVVPQEFPLTIGQQVYEMGAAAPDFDTQRPARIERAGIISLNNPAQPLELPILYLSNPQKWAEIPVKNVTSSLPQVIYDDNGFPYRKLSFYPIPSAAVKVALYTWTQLSRIDDLDIDIEFPPGYFEAIKYNLAVRMVPEWGAKLDPVTAGLAITSLSKIKASNAPLLEMRCDSALNSNGRVFNWLTGR